MRKLFILLIAIMLTVPTFISADEIELGLSVIPLSLLKSDSAQDQEAVTGGGGGFFQDNLVGLHAGYSLAWLFYGSIDANIMPPWWVQATTTFTDAEGNYVQGVSAPGFLCLIDVGIRPTFGPIIVMAELGMNYLYIHSAYNFDPVTGEKFAGGNTGANLRLGVGWKFSMFSASITGTAVYPNFDALVNTVKGLANNDPYAVEAFKASIVPALAFYVHL